MLGTPCDVLWLKGTTGISWAKFDPEWYLARYPDVRHLVSVDEPNAVLRFYLISGQQIGHSPNRYFDEAWYVRQYPEIEAAISAGEFASGFHEYCNVGFTWRSPHWLYDDWLYRYFHERATGAALDDQLLQSGGFVNRYDHYLREGSRIGATASLLFDADYYLEQLDLTERAEAKTAGAFSHYLRMIEAGRSELRTTIYFDPYWYRQMYSDVAGAIGTGWLSALHHYLTNPTPTAFDPLAYFSETFYREHQADVAPAVDEGRLRNFYQHFLCNGVFELRAPHERISLRTYIDEHAQVREDLDAGVVRDAFAHLLRFGTRLGFRIPPNEEVPAKILFRARALALVPILARRPINFDTGGVPPVSVIMAVRDNFALTLQALASLRNNFPDTIELILVDCGSTDETRFIERYVHGAQVLHFDSNLGFVHACNVALTYTSADAVLYLNNDVELAPGSVAAALDRLTSDVQIGAVGGKIIRSHGRLQEAGCIIWRDGTTLGYKRDASPLAPEVNFVRDVDYCSAVFLLVRSAPVHELGGFDAAFAPAYYEDADLCVRIRQAGYRVVYDPSAVVHHLEYGTSGDRLPVRQVRENQRIFVSKNATWLQSQHEQDARVEVFARSTIRNARRLLFIEDTVPMRRLGSGFVRSNDLVRTMVGLGWHVTVHPVDEKQLDPAAVYTDFPDTVEVMYDRSLGQLEEFLSVRAGYYDTIWIARTHNLDRVMPILERCFGDRDRPRYILDTEAIVALRDAERARLVNSDVPFDVDAAILREFGNARFCHRLIAVNEHEAAVLRRLALGDVSVLGHMREVVLSPREWKDRSGLLFVGAIHVLDSPNYDSLCWFVDTVLPVVEQALGWETRLTVVGYTGEGISLERFRNHPRVTLRGPVADTRNLYDAHRVFVAPTRYAAGVPYKVHEAASLGLPVVASELLCQQLGWEHGKELLAADVADPDAFARYVIELYRSEALWTSIRTAAAERVRIENDPRRYCSLVGSILDDLLQTASSSYIAPPNLGSKMNTTTAAIEPRACDSGIRDDGEEKLPAEVSQIAGAAVFAEIVSSSGSTTRPNHDSSQAAPGKLNMNNVEMPLPFEFEQTFINFKFFGTAQGYDAVAAVLVPTSLGADVAGLRIRELGSGRIAGRVTDEESQIWQAYASHLPPGFHLVRANLAEFSAFERDPQGILRTSRDLVFDVVDGFGRPIASENFFAWYGARTLPMPERENIIRVAGDVGPDGFLFGGSMWHSRLEDLIRRYVGRASSTLDHILDWGVGCGRIARHFLERGQTNVAGADIDNVNIQWLRENLNWQDAVRVGFDPPMPYPTGHFDVVYGHSVFTHLSEKDHFPWLTEIARVLKPGGFAFLTFCTEPGLYVTQYKSLMQDPSFLDGYLSTGFLDIQAQNVGVDAGREGYYRLVAQTRNFILNNWSRHFLIRRIFPCYMEHQDLVILQKPD